MDVHLCPKSLIIKKKLRRNNFWDLIYDCLTLSLRQKINLLWFSWKSYLRCIASHGVQICGNCFNILFCLKVRVKTMVSKLFLTVHILIFFYCYFAIVLKGLILRKLGVFEFFGYLQLFEKYLKKKKTYF